MRRIRVLYRDASLSQVVATWNKLKTEEQELFKRARPTKKLCEGDKIFLRALDERSDFFTLKLRYEGETLVESKFG